MAERIGDLVVTRHFPEAIHKGKGGAAHGPHPLGQAIGYYGLVIATCSELNASAGQVRPVQENVVFGEL